MQQELNDPDFLEELFEDSDGIPVQLGEHPATFGHRSLEAALQFELAQVYGTEDLVVVVTEKVPGAGEAGELVGQPITVDGTPRKVVGNRPLDDGALSVIALGDLD